MRDPHSPLRPPNLRREGLLQTLGIGERWPSRISIQTRRLYIREKTHKIQTKIGDFIIVKSAGAFEVAAFD